MASRAYDYACPSFGGFAIPQPSWEPPRRSDISHRSTAALIKQASIISNSGSLSRGNSLEGRAPLSRMDSNPRSPLARMDSGSKTESYKSSSTTSTSESSYGTGAGGRPTMYSSATYKSPYGNNYRHFSYK